MMELMTGEAGVLRTALGVVLAREGIDVRVRVYLWSGGVEDVVLPTMNAEPFPVGAQVIVLFLSDRTASGMVLGAIEGLLSWRRVAAPAFVERMQPQLQETMARCSGLDATLTVVENAFTLDPDEGQGLFGAARGDGRREGVLCPGADGGGDGGDPAAHLGSAHGRHARGRGTVGAGWRRRVFERLPAAGRAGVPDAVVGRSERAGVHLRS